MRADLHSQQDLSGSLTNQKKSLEDDLCQVRDRNREDAAEIDKLNV